MHLPAALGSRSSSESDKSISMTLGSQSSLQKQRAGIILSSTTTDPLANLDSWTSAVGTNSKAFMPHKLGTSGRGRLPSIGEVHPASKLTFPAQEGFAQMFSQNIDNSVFVKRRNPQLAQQQSTHQGPRLVRDRIIKHSLSESHLRARVEPIPDDEPHPSNNGLNENTNVWLTPATAVGTVRHPGTRPLPVAQNRNGHREIVTIDGRLRRVRFLSADHVPAKEDPEFKRLFLNRNVADVKKNINVETISKVKPNEGKKSPVRAIAVTSGRKTSVDNGEVTAAPKTADDKKESPDVWLERARKLRASKDKLNNNVMKAESMSKRSESLKIHDNEDANNFANKLSERIPSTPKHVNYCDEKKTEWVRKWLDDVNSQTHFDIIE